MNCVANFLSTRARREGLVHGRGSAAEDRLQLRRLQAPRRCRRGVRGRRGGPLRLERELLRELAGGERLRPEPLSLRDRFLHLSKFRQIVATFS